MKRIFGDFETFYSKTYSLRKMTPAEYILGTEYETIMCGVCEDDKPAFVLPGDEVAEYLRDQTEPYMFVSHNALFDACILSLRYNIHPKLLICTMRMCNALLMHKLPHGRVSLENVSSYLGLGSKDHQALGNVTGLTRSQIEASPGLIGPLAGRAKLDVEQCRGIYNTLKGNFPASEHVIMDMIIRMATQPKFTVDETKLWEHLAIIQQEKADLLTRCGLEDNSSLMSNDKFADALRAMGIDPPLKVSPITGKVAYAFAKTDEDFTDLADHEDPDVQALIAARVGVKSTLEESRTQRLISIGSHSTLAMGLPWLPVPLRYSGAHTHRFSGDWKINLQNLPSRKSKKLREGLRAPDGCTVLAIDAAQIEARLTAWLSGQWDLVQAFADGIDIYSDFASDMYGVVVTKKDELLRLAGKIVILASGFGMGPPKMQATIRIEALKAGRDIIWTLEEAQKAIYLFRRKFGNIKDTWRWLNDALPRIASGECEGEMFGPCTLHQGRVGLPSGLSLFYEDLKYSRDEWRFTYGGKRKKLYGGKFLENIVQALDRVFVMEAAIRIKTRMRVEYGYDAQLAHQVHDELIYVPEDAWLETLMCVGLEEMSRPPEWGPDLPVFAEAKIGLSYGELKGV